MSCHLKVQNPGCLPHTHTPLLSKSDRLMGMSVSAQTSHLQLLGHVSLISNMFSYMLPICMYTYPAITSIITSAAKKENEKMISR